MTKKLDLAKVDENQSLLAMPEYMQDLGLVGVEDLSKYITPPRLKVVQPLSDRDTFLSRFVPGDVVAVPQLLLISPFATEDGAKDYGTPFFLTPIFFFPEWCLWNPLSARGTLPAIRARSLDPKSDLAAKSRSQATWNEDCVDMPVGQDGKYPQMRYVEHLNFISLLHNKPELGNVPVVMSFSKAEHRCGSTFAALIKMRRAPLFGGNYEAKVGFRQNTKGQWYGIDVVNPTTDSGVPPFVLVESTYEDYQRLYEECKTAHEQSKIVVSYEDEENAIDGAVVTPSMESAEY